VVGLKSESSVERWRLIAVQFSFAISIIASVAVADRLLAMSLGGESVGGAMADWQPP